MTDNEKLRAIKPIEYSKYYEISSLEKLAVYGIKYLMDNGIDTSWTNIVICTYYLFPEKFAISEDFIDFPNAERLNRTLLHLVPHKGRNYAIGSAKEDYILTPLGKEIALEVEKIINNKDSNNNEIKKSVISKIKNTPMTYYVELTESKEYKKYLETKQVSIDMLWGIYKVIPYTQYDKIQKSLKNAKTYAIENNDTDCENFITIVLELLK